MRRAAPSATVPAALALTAALAVLPAAGAWAAGAQPAVPAPGPAPGEAPPADPSVLTFPPLSIAFPKPEKALLRNGLLVYLFEDHELPLVDLAFMIRAGSIYDPPEKAGLASIAAALLRTGGTRGMTPDEVDETLEFLPARLSIDAGADAVTGSLSALRARFPEALRVLAAMLREPRLDAARLEVEKARLIEDIRRRWDEPGTIAALQFRLLVYGPASPWARLDSAETLGRIGRDDLAAWHRRYIRPNNAVLGVAGDFDPRAMKKTLEETFAGWTHAKVTPPPVARVGDAIPVGLHLVRRPLTQTSVRMGHLGVNRFHPDKFPIKILNYILGEGGFSSRLVQEVRSTRGLAYGIFGGIGLDSDRGLFEIGTRTGAASTLEAIQVARDVVRDLRDRGPTEQEVRDAKEASINSFVFSVDGTVPYMNAFLYYDYHRYPPDYLRTYRDHLAKVTREEVHRAARKHLDPERLVVLLVGDEDRIGRPLADLGLGAPRLIALDGASPPAP
jgi:predicted Zn-dependent peptidase